MKNGVRSTRFRYFHLHLFHLQFLVWGIALPASLVGQFCQIVCLELDAIEFVVAAQFLDLLLAVLPRHGVLAVLVAGELLV